VGGNMALDLSDVISAGDNSGNDSSKYLTILKDLSNKELINTFSELTDAEVKILTRLNFIAQIINSKYGGKQKIINVDNYIKAFMTYRISKDRKSREEFINAMNSPKISDTESSMLKRMQSMGGMLR
jgi:hypothetical protein